jgi:hypothetical protein
VLLRSNPRRKHGSTPQHPGQLWDPWSVLYNWYQGLFPQGCEADHSPPSSAEVENGELYHHSLICFHGMVLIYLSIGTTLPLRNIHKMIWNHWCEFWNTVRWTIRYSVYIRYWRKNGSKLLHVNICQMYLLLSMVWNKAMLYCQCFSPFV